MKRAQVWATGSLISPKKKYGTTVSNFSHTPLLTRIQIIPTHLLIKHLDITINNISEVKVFSQILLGNLPFCSILYTYIQFFYTITDVRIPWYRPGDVQHNLQLGFTELHLDCPWIHHVILFFITRMMEIFS